jgi:RimJ/RimL family protein N-acetyltransferase
MAPALPRDLSVPLLQTSRLTLRRHQLSDFEPAAAMWGDPAVTRHVGGRPFTREEVWARLMRYVGHWALMGFGYWAIVERESGVFVGEAGFADFKREIEPSLEGTPELGWVIAPRAQGLGYATEAAGAAVAWGDAAFDSRRTACLIHPENLASIRVAAKLGFQQVQGTLYKGYPTLLFARG